MWDERQQLLGREGIEAIVAATLPSWFTSATLRDRPDFVQKIEQMITATSVSGYLGATKALQGLTLLPTLGEMTCPVLYLVGEDDGVHPQAMQAMQQATPASQLVSLVGAAHLSNLEQPEGFMSAVLPFLLAHSEGENP
jgi:3-oxoadipate enol-lactonase